MNKETVKKIYEVAGKLATLDELLRELNPEIMDQLCSMADKTPVSHSMTLRVKLMSKLAREYQATVEPYIMPTSMDHQIN